MQSNFNPVDPDSSFEFIKKLRMDLLEFERKQEKKEEADK